MKLRWLLWSLAAIIGISTTTAVVQASDFTDGPNVDQYVYEDREYITNSQYARLAAINDRLQKNSQNPQAIYLALSQNEDDTDDMGIANREDAKEIAAKDKKRADYYGSNGYEFSSGISDPNYFFKAGSSRSEYHELKRTGTILSYDMKRGLVVIRPSTLSQDYVTDFIFWKMRWGLNFQLKHGSEESRINALLSLAERLEPKLEKVGNADTRLTAPSFDGIDRVLSYASIVAVGLQILIAILYHAFRRKDKFGGPSIDVPEESYEAGFDEGYYFGSQTQDKD